MIPTMTWRPRLPHLSLVLSSALLASCLLDVSGQALSSAGATSASAGGGASPTGSGGEGGSSTTAVCGDGVVQGQEACDDGSDVDPNDGCHNCTIEAGYACEGQPSQCKPIEPLVVSIGPNFHKAFPADAYDGSPTSMTCVNLPVNASPGAKVHAVRIELGLQSSLVGDLVIKLVHPYPQYVTLLSRPGMVEAFDDGTGDDRGSAGLSPTFPIRFYDQAAHDAENMAAGLSQSDTVCEDAPTNGEKQCDFRPNAGAAPGGQLDDFDGLDASGDWRICVADAAGTKGGYIESVTLSVTAW